MKTSAGSEKETQLCLVIFISRHFRMCPWLFCGTVAHLCQNLYRLARHNMTDSRVMITRQKSPIIPRPLSRHIEMSSFSLYLKTSRPADENARGFQRASSRWAQQKRESYYSTATRATKSSRAGWDASTIQMSNKKNARVDSKVGRNDKENGGEASSTFFR